MIDDMMMHSVLACSPSRCRTSRGAQK